ncbi:LamG domain-containing protein [Brevibacillus laterosporus]|uniref:Concanavalin A-like lectin/glucanases superfamily protein n=1 Tax=Brevibacillus laterosporus LMG 15441 TaxID=1042163 RepID=A0A075R3I6_BRELA|nr:DNRLRE domain-containing protein [Brevibacillus laterosporus]AIG26414.1 concanavalin A-like lectin/glucanases superfamily protein [Brevibacillus laterosporus LMG 15441]RJL07671.1 LamG domain-containing protein [Brevibacillus laterosporus]TPH13619.1 LamG domain-containing protein [Brevibacillus laterosporus]
MFIKEGLVLSLHASLADQGLTRGNNATPTTKWHDLSGNNNHGTLHGFQYNSQSGWTGNNTASHPYTLYFDGYGGYVTCGRASQLKLAASITFEAWFYFIGGSIVLSSGGQVEGTQGIALLCNDMGELELHVTTPDNQAMFNLGYQSKSEWYHVIGSFDEHTGYLSAYLNGAPQGRSKAISGTYTDPLSDLMIGRHHKEMTKWFRGTIPVVRIYNRALSMDEVAQNYLAGYLLYKNESQIPSHIIVPKGHDVRCSLQIGTSGIVKGKYRSIPSGVKDIPSSIKINQAVGFAGSLYITPQTILQGKYHIKRQTNSDISSSISIHHTNHLESKLSVRPKAILSGKYQIKELFSQDVDSTIQIIQRDTLVCHLSLLLKGQLTSRYLVKGITANELSASLTITNTSNLAGKLGVTSSQKLIAQYKIIETTVDDLTSWLNITATSQLSSRVGISTQTRLIGRYDMIPVEGSDLVSSLNITSNADFNSRLKIATRGFLKAKYGMIRGDYSNLASNLSIKETNDVPSSLGIAPYTRVIAKYGIIANYASDILADMTIKVSSNLPALLRISPYTYIRSKYEILAPPEFTAILYATKDAFVREAVPRLNYGIEQQMYIGHDSSLQDTFRSYIGFDLAVASIPPSNVTIKKAVVKLYVDGRNIPPKQVQMIEPVTNWTEYGITWKNQPYPFGFDSPTSSYDGINVIESIEGNSRYIPFDITDSIKKWYEKKKDNFGFIVRAFNELENSSLTFFTREQRSHRPILEITYYDTRIYSLGRDSCWSEITVRQSKSSDVVSALRIRQFQGYGDLPVHLFLVSPRDLLSELTVNREQLISRISVRQSAHHDTAGYLKVFTKEAFWIESSLFVSVPDRPSHIYILNREDVNSKLAVRREGLPYPKIHSTLFINRDVTVGEVIVRQSSKIDFFSDLTVNRDDLHASLSVYNGFDTLGFLSITVEDQVDLSASGFVKFHDSLSSMLLVHKTHMHGSLNVVYASHLAASLHVRIAEDEQLKAKLAVKFRNNLLSSLSIYPKFDVPSHIFVLSGYLTGHLAIPYQKGKDIPSFVTIRVKAVSDLESFNQVQSGYLGSSIQVRTSTQHDVPSSLAVQLQDRSECSAHLVVNALGKADVEGQISARKMRYAFLWCFFAVRLSDSASVDSNLIVRVADGDDLHSTISIRVFSNANLVSHVAVRREDFSELLSLLLLKEHHNLLGTMAIRVQNNADIWSSMEIWEKSLLSGNISVRKNIDSDLSCSCIINVYSEIESHIDVVAEYGYVFIM